MKIKKETAVCSLLSVLLSTGSPVRFEQPMASAWMIVPDEYTVGYIGLINHHRASPTYRFLAVLLDKSTLDPSADDRGIDVIFTTCLSDADPNPLEMGELLKVRLLITRKIRTDVLVTH
jgi:hypothetical protein